MTVYHELEKWTFYYEYVELEKCIYFMSDTIFLFLFTFFSTQEIFYFLNIFVFK